MSFELGHVELERNFLKKRKINQVIMIQNIIEHGVMLKIIFNLPKRLKIYRNIPNILVSKILMGRGTI